MRRSTIIKIVIGLVFMTCLIGAWFFTNHQSAKAPENPKQTNKPKSHQEKPEPKSKPKQYIYASPTANFKKRATKKLFGTFVTPGNSPVSPERFSGYHTGTDAEYGDVKGEITVRTIATGKVIAAQYVSGYGGVVAVSSNINGAAHIVIYGHVDPNRLPSVDSQLKQGQSIAFLGVGYSQQTDGERRHLHLAILASNTLNWRGYVNSKAELSGWLNPLTILSQTK